MARMHSRNTSPEMRVRRAVHAAGFRFRLHRKDLPGSPDLVFSRYRTAVFVHGCFWHWHRCKRSRMPEANRDYWEAKIQRNIDRDAKNVEALRALGWTVVVIWECAIEDGTDELLCIVRRQRAEHIIQNPLRLPQAPS